VISVGIHALAVCMDVGIVMPENWLRDSQRTFPEDSNPHFILADCWSPGKEKSQPKSLFAASLICLLPGSPGNGWKE